LDDVQLERFTDNVADLMVARVKRLPRAAREALSVAACVGVQFDVALLGSVLGRGVDDVGGDLEPAEREGLIAAAPDADACPLRFSHDKVQQAAAALLDADERKAVR